MKRRLFCFGMAFPAMMGLTASLRAEDPRFPGVALAMKARMDDKEIAGAVTAVITRDGKVALQTHGMADLAAQRPMTPDTLFWIASMTKPVTGVAVLMLQDEGKLKVSDPVANYLPEFAGLKTPSGQPADLTITQLMTHTSGLGEAAGPAAQEARTLADLVPLWLAAPMQYEPGAQWKYTQSGINAAARIVEVVSGQAFEIFLQQRLFDPLGMKNTTFYPTEEQRARLATGYAKDKATGSLVPVPPRPGYGTRHRPPQGNGGLFSTGPDYANFCLMLLQGGTFRSSAGGAERRLLSPEAMALLTKPLTGGLPTGFFQNGAYGPRGKNYGWGLGTCILREPHPGVAARLSPGTYGHGGAWGTQAWLDPVKGAGYLLMVQRADFPNSDGSGVREAFQNAAVEDLGKIR
jgi:CubicO group peptidase (beta-lactamase class C family)